MIASDASTPVELVEERSPQIDELVLWVLQHGKKRLAVIGRKRNEVAGECDGIQQDTSCVIGAFPGQPRREFECLRAGDTGAGKYRHGRKILRDRQCPSDWETSDSGCCMYPRDPVAQPADMLLQERGPDSSGPAGNVRLQTEDNETQSRDDRPGWSDQNVGQSG
jgi:hypothetical protein